MFNKTRSTIRNTYEVLVNRKVRKASKKGIFARLGGSFKYKFNRVKNASKSAIKTFKKKV